MNIGMKLQTHTAGTNSGMFSWPDLQLMYPRLYKEKNA